MATGGGRRFGRAEDKTKIDFKNEPLDSSGAPINQYIPKFISEAPWYVAQENVKDTLAHLKKAEKQEFAQMGTWYERGTFGNTAKRFKVGSCRNCGSSTHSEKECVERPRKQGAWKTNDDIKPDEILQPELNLTWDGKRDRWNGYDYSKQKKYFELYELAAAEKLHSKRNKDDIDMKETMDDDQIRFKSEIPKKIKEKSKQVVDTDSDSDDNSDGSEISSSSSSSGIFPDSDHDKTSIDEDLKVNQDNVVNYINFNYDSMKQCDYNLRIREDIAVYLKDLDNKEIKYNPKSRSVHRINSKNNDDFIKEEKKEFDKTQRFAWEAHAQGANVNFYADPTAVALMRKEFEEKKKKLQQLSSRQLVEKYGVDMTNTLNDVSKDILYGETDNFTLYDKNGNLIQGFETKKKSKYTEDEYPGNHKSIWGSWYNIETSEWGYKCCHQTLYSAYCTGILA